MEEVQSDDPVVAQLKARVKEALDAGDFNLASVYEKQGRYEEAEPLYKRSLRIAEKALGPAHPNVVTIKKNIAIFYQSWNKSKEEKQGNAVKVEDVVENSQALKVGLKKGDLIIQYDNVRTKRVLGLINEVKKKADKEKIDLLVVRDGALMEFVIAGGPLGVRIQTTVIPEEELEDVLADPDEFGIRQRHAQ